MAARRRQSIRRFMERRPVFYETCNYIRGKDNQISLFRHSDDIFIYPFSVIRSRSVSVSLEKLYTQAKIMTGGIAASMPV